MVKQCLLIWLGLIGAKRLAATELSGNPIEGDRVVPEYQRARSRERLPGDRVLPHLDLSQEANIHKLLEPLEQRFASQLEGVKLADVVEEHPKPSPIVPKKPAAPKLRAKATAPQPPPFFARENTKVFHENAGYAQQLSGLEVLSLPSNSAALATVVAGLKVRPGASMRLPVTLNYAFLGPNEAVVEMSGCEAYISVESDVNVSRLYGELGSLSCRAPTGQTFNIAFKAHIVDEQDNFVGVEGRTVLNGKLSAGLLAFLQDGTSAFGKAMAAAQVTTQVQTSSEGKQGVSGSNVKGNKDQYIAGQTIAGATGRFLNWWVDYYQAMQPTVEVASGRKLFLLSDGEFEIPKVFFGDVVEPQKLSRVNTRATLIGKKP